jgi:hypothetical protein
LLNAALARRGQPDRLASGSRSLYMQGADRPSP